MPVLLSDIKKSVPDALSQLVIDEFRKNNFILDNIPFEQAVSPVGGGGTLTYGYVRVITPATAAFRAINNEYDPQEAVKERYSVDLKVFGGAFEIDRVLANMGGIVDEVDFQMKQKIKSAQALFNDTVINGDSATNILAFDGLDKALTGSATEYNAGGTAINLSSTTNIDSNYKVFLDEVDMFLSNLDGKPSFLAGNSKLMARIRAVAMRSSLYTSELNAFGQKVSMYDGIPLVDLGAKSGSTDPVVAIDAGGETSLFAGRFGLDGLHAVSMAGLPPIRAWLPDFTTAGAVKTGEVEMVAAIALKATKAAGVMRKIKVQ